MRFDNDKRGCFCTACTSSLPAGRSFRRLSGIFDPGERMRPMGKCKTVPAALPEYSEWVDGVQAFVVRGNVPGLPVAQLSFIPGLVEPTIFDRPFVPLCALSVVEDRDATRAPTAIRSDRPSTSAPTCGLFALPINHHGNFGVGKHPCRFAAE